VSQQYCPNRRFIPTIIPWTFAARGRHLVTALGVTAFGTQGVRLGRSHTIAQLLSCPMIANAISPVIGIHDETTTFYALARGVDFRLLQRLFRPWAVGLAVQLAPAHVAPVFGSSRTGSCQSDPRLFSRRRSPAALASARANHAAKPAVSVRLK
jgi:hypothetical protein